MEAKKIANTKRIVQFKIYTGIYINTSKNNKLSRSISDCSPGISELRNHFIRHRLHRSHRKTFTLIMHPNVASFVFLYPKRIVQE